MEEYIVPEIEEAKVFALQAGEYKKAANLADKHGDNYLLLSIFISMVLFFTGWSVFPGHYFTKKYSWQHLLLFLYLFLSIC